MRKSSPIFLLLSLFAVTSVAGPPSPKWVGLGGKPYQAQPQVEVSTQFSEEIVIQVNMAGFIADRVESKVGWFASIEIPGCGQTNAIGKARLPVLRRAIEIPQGAAPNVEVIEYTTTTYALADLNLPPRIYPVQPPIEKIPGARQRAPFKMSESFYASSKPYPSYKACIVEIGQMRGHRFAVLEIPAAIYIPASGTLEIVTNIGLRVTVKGADEAATRATIDRYASPYFEAIASKALLNYKHPTIKAIPQAPVGFLVITSPDYYTEILPLAEWKSQRGYYTTVTQTPDIPGGATTTAIKSYIQDAYENWDVPPTFVLLVGDVDAIPNWTGTEIDNPPTDLYYTTMTEPDYIPDIAIGRISVSSATEAQAAVGKILNYEKRLFSHTSWLKKAVFMASEDNWDITEGTHNYVISTYMDPAGFTSLKLYCHTYNATTQDVSDAFNEGTGLGIYSGHGATTYWADGPQFMQSNVAALTNLDMYPFVQSYACLTGRYTEAECFAETWIRQADKAAVGFWASSVTSYWDEDDVLEKGVFKALFEDSLTWIGGMIDQGKWHLYEYYGGAGSTRRYYEMYNLLGDPSVDIWTDEPHTMDVAYATAIPVGATSYEVHASENSTPLPDAMASLFWPGTLFGSGYTNSSGDAMLDLNPSPNEPGEMILTLTHHNFTPFSDTLQVVVPATVVIDPDTIEVGVTTAVSVAVLDTLSAPVESVEVTIDGWGIEPPLHDTTDASGQAYFSISAPYGEALSVKGSKLNQSYDLFNDSLYVVGAIALPNPAIEARVDAVGLVGALTPDFEGTIVGRSDHAGLDIFARGCGIDTSASSSSDSVIVAATPDCVGQVKVALASPGYEVYEDEISVIIAYGTLAGTVLDSTTAQPIEGALLRAYPSGSDTSSTPSSFETLSQADGSYASSDSLRVGAYQVYSTKFGYLASAGSTMIRVGANTYDILMIPAPAGIVTGTVTEEGTGKPLSATLEIYRSDDMSLYSEATSDSLSGGSYTTEPLPYFTYVFTVKATHYITKSINVTVAESTQTVNFELTPTEGNLLVIDDDTGDLLAEVKVGEKGETLSSLTRALDYEAKSSASLIAEDLASLGYDVTTQSSAATDPATWQDYDLIIWSSGDDTSPVSVSSYRSNLNSYVASGGKLLIEGGEIGYDAASSPGYPNLADTTLHIVEWQHDSSGDLSLAMPNHPVATTPNILPSTITMSYVGYGDEDALTGDAQTQAIFEWSSYPGLAGVFAYDNNPDTTSCQIIFFSFDYSNAADSTSRVNLLENAVSYLLRPEPGAEGSISGIVELYGETNYEGTIVRLSPMGLADTTDAAGNYYISGLFDGAYKVTATKQGFADSSRTVVISGGSHVGDVNFTLYPVIEYMDSPEIAIPDNDPAGIRAYINVDADQPIASVDCYVNISHTYVGDLIVELTSPEGSTVRLHNRTGGSSNDIVTWYDTDTEPDGPGTMSDFTGEIAAGQWELWVSDQAGADTGTLHTWGLHLSFPWTSAGLSQGTEIYVTRLIGISPLPLSSCASFTFSLAKAEQVDIAIYNVCGQRLAEITSAKYEPGLHSLIWRIENQERQSLASGIYFCRFKAGEYQTTRRIVIIR